MISALLVCFFCLSTEIMLLVHAHAHNNKIKKKKYHIIQVIVAMRRVRKTRITYRFRDPTCQTA